jgi:lipopolysaccharide transport system permease protein
VLDSEHLPAPAVVSTHKVTVVRSTSGWRALNLGELLGHQDLLGFLIWRDLKVRYQQTLLGGAWAILQPLAAAAAFSLVFGKLAKLPSDGVSYPLFSFSGMVVWTYFSQAITAAIASLVGNARLIQQVYFPRLVLPLAAVLRGIVDFAIAFIFLALILAVTGHLPSWRWLSLPFLLAIAVIAAAGAGMGLAAINVRFRDVGQMTPLMIQLWLFLTPVVYPASLAPAAWRPWLGLNPMAGVVEGFRWALLVPGAAPVQLITVSAASALLMLAGGLLVFRRVESAFADVI